MMKRIVSLLLLAALALSMTACAKKPANDVTTDQDANGFTANLAEFYESLAGEDFPMMMALAEDDLIESLYPGLTEIERVQTVLYTAAISITPCEIAMVEVRNSADVEKAEAIFQARIDAQVAGGAWYPDTIEQWKNNAQIVVRGNYVCMFVVPEELPSPADAFNAL